MAFHGALWNFDTLAHALTASHGLAHALTDIDTTLTKMSATTRDNSRHSTTIHVNCNVAHGLHYQCSNIFHRVNVGLVGPWVANEVGDVPMRSGD